MLKSFGATFLMPLSEEPEISQEQIASQSAKPFRKRSYFFSSIVAGRGAPQRAAITFQKRFLGCAQKNAASRDAAGENEPSDSGGHGAFPNLPPIKLAAADKDANAGGKATRKSPERSLVCRLLCGKPRLI